MEVIVMRELNTLEMEMVSGGVGVCTPGNSLGQIGDPSRFGDNLISIYEGMVAATSHVIERVAGAF